MSALKQNNSVLPTHLPQQPQTGQTENTETSEEMTRKTLRYVFENFAENTTAHAPPKVRRYIALVLKATALKP